MVFKLHNWNCVPWETVYRSPRNVCTCPSSTNHSVEMALLLNTLEAKLDQLHRLSRPTMTYQL